MTLEDPQPVPPRPEEPPLQDPPPSPTSPEQPPLEEPPAHDAPPPLEAVRAVAA